MSFLFQTITIASKTTIRILNGSIEEITLLKEKQVGLEYEYRVIRQHRTEQAAFKFSRGYYDKIVREWDFSKELTTISRCTVSHLLNNSFLPII